jgi:hydroxyacylglutathione hydrolase
VGYDNCLGYLNGGIEAWKKAGNEVDSIETIDAEAFAVRQQETAVLDVRRKSEFDAEHVVGAQSLPLDFINKLMDEVERDRTYLVHCAGGYRSVIAISILKARGFDKLINVAGGYNAIKASGKVAVTQYQEQITEL